MSVLLVPGGKLSCYQGGGRKRRYIQAECGNRGHGRCIKSRTTIKARDSDLLAPVGTGRPLGFLAAWLAKGTELDSKDTHWGPDGWTTLAEKKAARDMIRARAANCLDAQGLLAAEASDPEGDEPELEE